jgi:hypothetical protein
MEFVVVFLANYSYEENQHKLVLVLHYLEPVGSDMVEVLILAEIFGVEKPWLQIIHQQG